MSFKWIGSILFGFLTLLATVLSLTGSTLQDIAALLTGPQSLEAHERAALAAHLRDVIADAHISVEERARLRERVLASAIDEEAADLYLAEVEPEMLQAAREIKTGLRFATTGRFSEARKRFAEAVRLDAEHAGGWANLAGAALELGSLGECEAASLRALTLDERNVAAHYNLAACLARQVRVAVALDHLDQALELVLDGDGTPVVDRSALLADLRSSPHFASLRGLPRFEELLRRLADADG